MNVNNTIDLLEGYARDPAVPDRSKALQLRDDIIQAMKFDLGDEFSGMPGFTLSEARISVPMLPFDKVYFEAVSSDGKRYGAIFENFGEYGVCGQMLVEARAEHDRAKKGLFPVGLVFTQNGDELEIHAEHDDLEDMKIGSIGALHLMVRAIAVINCSNVQLVDSPEKKWINKQRQRKGKLPLFTYKTLHIKTSKRVDEKWRGAGTHASPRVHLRRGHIRRLPSGKTVWVQPCVVGDKNRGIVHKDYSVSAH
jgi:hypothetical protein